MRDSDIYNKDMKTVRKLFIGAVVFWVMCALAGLAMSASIVYLVLRIASHS